MTSGPRSAHAAGLRYATDSAPGIQRAGRTGAFVYRLADGRRVRDAATLARIRAMVLPPAWTDVWIAPDPHAHLQATGRDAAGRKQYRYHAAWVAERDATKYQRLQEFARALPAIRRRVARDMNEPPRSRPRVLATVVRLLERTHFRIGNEAYVKANRSHGLTTLRVRHVDVRGTRVRFAFRAKSGVAQATEFRDERLARAILECQDLPGQPLFQYVDDRSHVRTVSSTDVNRYLKTIAAASFTAKDFRTWAGTVGAAVALTDLGPAASAAAAKRSIVAAVKRVASALGNTPAVCRKGYIHPSVLDLYRHGLTLASVDATVEPIRGLSEKEARLVALLRRRPRLVRAA